MEQKKYALHISFANSITQSEIENKFDEFLVKVLERNRGSKLIYTNEGRNDLYYSIRKFRSCYYGIWNIAMSYKPFDDENLGIRLTRIMRHIRENFKQSILRAMYQKITEKKQEIIEE